MEYISFKPIIEPIYNTDLVKSIITFNAYNLPNYVKATLINNRIVITVRRANTNVYFLLTKPFDYPNNFDYFQISCTCKYSDMSTITLFVDTVNTFIKSSIVNVSFGWILEFMNKKRDLISENSEFEKSETIAAAASTPLARPARYSFSTFGYRPRC